MNHHVGRNGVSRFCRALVGGLLARARCDSLRTGRSSAFHGKRLESGKW